jgi:hypothetical protein
MHQIAGLLPPSLKTINTRIFWAWLLSGLCFSVLVLGLIPLNKWALPWVLLGLFSGWLAFGLSQLLTQPSDPAQVPATSRDTKAWLGGAIGLFGILGGYKVWQSLWQQYAVPDRVSDVLPQLEALASRYWAGVQPYFPLTEYAWHPFPVYMPAHWLPLIPFQRLGWDVRWSGMVLMALALGLWGYSVGGRRKNPAGSLLAILLPALPVWAFAHWQPTELAVTLETTVAAYYLLLGVGLLTRRPWLWFMGLLGCLLSRYTLVFWMPLLIFMVWKEWGLRKTGILTLCLCSGFLVFYVLPFLWPAPHILWEGLHYHNDVAISDWEGSSWNFESGLYFAPWLRHWFSGTMTQRVWAARTLQGFLMLVANGLGIGLYLHLRTRMQWEHYALWALTGMMGLFYLWGPLLYQYYYLPLLCLMALSTSQAVLERD